MPRHREGCSIERSTAGTNGANAGPVRSGPDLPRRILRPPFRRLSAWFLAALHGFVLLTSPAHSAQAHEITLVGTVLSAGSQPLHSVKIVAPELHFEESIDLLKQGAVKIQIPATRKTHFRCQLSAPGFKEMQLTVVVKGRRADLGRVQLQPSAEISRVSVTEMNGGFAGIEFWLTHFSSQTLTVERVALAASEPRQGGPSNCHDFDSTPQLILRFNAFAVSSPGEKPHEEIPLNLRVTTLSTGYNDERKVKGALIAGRCGEIDVRIEAPYSFTLSPEDANRPLKLRVEVPLSFVGAEGRPIHPDWQHTIVSLSLDDGGIISATTR